MNLPDVQQSQDPRGIALDQVGVCDVMMPITFDGQAVQASFDLSVDLDAKTKGTSMSRFVVLLNEKYRQQDFSMSKLIDFTNDIATAAESDAAQVMMSFQIFLDKPSPVSDYNAPQPYTITLTCDKNGDQTNINLAAHILASNCCPCSKAISDGGAHNQRVNILAKADLDLDQLDSFQIDHYLLSLESGASCPMHPILKRPDEKWVTEKQYGDPKFVEDVARDVIGTIKNYPGVQSWHVHVEAEESIHMHNAFASASG